MSAAVSPAGIRAEFESLVVRDLLGPFDGDDEEYPVRGFPAARDRYIVGALAPKKSYVAPGRSDGATAAEPGGGTAEDRVASPAQMVPSSLGLTFAVDAETRVLNVDASWGRYKRVSGFDEENKPVRRWQRTPAGGRAMIVLDPERPDLEPQFPDPTNEYVVLRGRTRPCGGCVLVTLFLVNLSVST